MALLNALDLRLRGAEIVVTGSDAEDFAQAALKLPFLDRIVLRANIRRRSAGVASGADQACRASGSAAFVCVGTACSLPVTVASEIGAAVAAMRA